MKILILGGTRFLGKKILDKLLDSDNNDIWVISRRNLLVKRNTLSKYGKKKWD